MDLTDLRHRLRTARTVAVVGCSPREGRPAHYVPRYLQSAGLRIIPVNPHHEEILGERCYPDLLSVPDDVEVDIVDVFRRPSFVPAVAEDAVAWAERASRQPVFYTQVGVHHPEAEQIAAAHGLPYVANRCLMVDHRALAG